MGTEVIKPETGESSFPEQKGPFQNLLDSVKGLRSLVILLHDNPDPDAISSAAALKYILGKLCNIRCKIVYGGDIVRPENRTMLQQLKIHLVPINQFKSGSRKEIALLDTQPGFGNHSMPKGMKPIIVIDHHPQKQKSQAIRFTDLRKNYGATATLLTEYLLESKLPIPTALATALFYGIASETQDLGREATEADTQAYLALFPKASKKILSKIRYAPVKRSYFRHIETGIRNSFTYKNVIGTRLGQVTGQDIVPLIADLLLRLERITWAIVMGWNGPRLYVSIRSSNPRARCGSLLRRVLGKTRIGRGA